MCGGTDLLTDEALDRVGLSPRVRGNLYRLLPGADGLGSIPACAGEPRMPLVRRRLQAVYPRVCGGTQNAQNALLRPEGLSPRVRGNLAEAGGQVVGIGSIPACAGEPA